MIHPPTQTLLTKKRKGHGKVTSILIILTRMGIQSGGNDSFVFDGVQGASGVNNAAIWLEHAHGAFEDANLKPW